MWKTWCTELVGQALPYQVEEGAELSYSIFGEREEREREFWGFGWMWECEIWDGDRREGYWREEGMRGGGVYL